jgi:hypothetical protein
MGKDVKGSGFGLISGIIPAFFGVTVEEYVESVRLAGLVAEI